MFKTIYGEYKNDISEKKSKFIALTKSINSQAGAKEFISEQKKIYYDARHVVYAYILSDKIKKYNDDGEPASTAGIPILKVLEHGNFFYTIIVVVRYFGGILLGANGLIRAYSLAAKKVLDCACILENETYEKITLKIEYDALNKINYLLQKNNCCMEKIFYSESIHATFFVKENICDMLLDNLIEAAPKKISVESKIKVTGAFLNKKFICCGDVE